MKIVPTQLEPPWPYAASKVLNPLRHPVTGPEFIARVRRFSRIGVLTLGTRFLWYTWNHDETVKAATPEAIGHRVTMAFAERVMMLAAIFGSDYNRPDPSEVEFRLLCWELHNASDEGIVALSSADELASRLTKVDSDSPLRRVTREHARTLLAEAFKARIAALQHVGRYFDRSHYARGYLIARAVAARASALGGAEYTRAEKQYLLSSVEGYFRGAWALFFKASTGLAIPVESGQPPMTDYGHVYAKDWPEDPNLEKVDLTVERMRAVAIVLSEPLSSFAAHRTTYQDADAAVLKYDASLDRLLIRPMIDVEHGGRCEHVAIPSPWRYVHAVPEIVLYDFVRYLQERRATVLTGQDAYSLRGQAFADYVRETIGRTSGVVDLDQVPELSGHERPDLLCAGTAHTLLVELKFSLKPNEDPILKDTSAAVKLGVGLPKPSRRPVDSFGSMAPSCDSGMAFAVR